MTRIIKVLVASCLLLLVTPSLAKAQSGNMRARQTSVSHELLPVQAGIKGALGFSFNAFSVGAYGSYNVTDFLGIGGEINYIKDFHVLKYSATNLDFIRTNCVPISIIAKIFPPKYPNFRFLGGMRAGYVISAHYKKIKKPDDIFPSSSNLKDIDLSKEKYNKWTCELVTGLEYEEDFGLFSGIEFSKGFIAITDNPESVLNCALRLTLGYNFAKFFE